MGRMGEWEFNSLIPLQLQLKIIPSIDTGSNTLQGQIKRETRTDRDRRQQWSRHSINPFHSRKSEEVFMALRPSLTDTCIDSRATFWSMWPPRSMASKRTFGGNYAEGSYCDTYRATPQRHDDTIRGWTSSGQSRGGDCGWLRCTWNGDLWLLIYCMCDMVVVDLCRGQRKKWSSDYCDEYFLKKIELTNKSENERHD